MDISASVQSMRTSTLGFTGSITGLPDTSNAAATGTTADSSAGATSVGTDTFTSSSTSLIVQQVVTQQVTLALEIHSTAAPASYPANVVEQPADTLVGKVLQKIDEEKSGEQLQHHSEEDRHKEAVNNVRMRVEHGFMRAASMLFEIGIYNDAVEADVASTRAQVDQAIDQAANQAVNQSSDPAITVPAENVPGVDAPAGVQTTVLSAASSARDLSSSLQLTTKEGDVVTIDLSRTRSQSAGVYMDNGIMLAYADKASSSQLNVSVQGDLNDQESASIREIVQSVNALARNLLSTDVTSVLEKLGSINFDSSQLSDMVLNMSSSYSYQAVSAYSEVSNLPAEPTAAPAVEATPVSATAPAAADTNVTSAVPPTPGTAASPTTTADSAAPTDSQGDTSTLTNEPDGRGWHHHRLGRSHEHGGFNIARAILDAVAVIRDTQHTGVFNDTGDALRKIFESIVDGLSAFDHKSMSVEHGDSVKQFFANVIEAANKPADTTGSTDVTTLQ